MSHYFTIKNKTYIQCGDTFYCITHLHHRQLTCIEISRETYEINLRIYTKDRLDLEKSIWEKSLKFISQN